MTDIKGKIVVVTDSSAKVFSCGVLKSFPAGAADKHVFETKISKVGSATVHGNVKVNMGKVGGHTQVAFTAGLDKADTKCTVTGGTAAGKCEIFMSKATKCTDSKDNLKKKFDNKLSAKYSVKSGKASFGSTGIQVPAATSAALKGRVVVVTDHSGAPVGCGQVRNKITTTNINGASGSGPLPLVLLLAAAFAAAGPRG